MGWSKSEHWPEQDPRVVARLRAAGLEPTGRKCPPVRSAESSAKLYALREGVDWRGGVDQDGNATSERFVQPPLLEVLREHSAKADSGELDW